MEIGVERITGTRGYGKACVGMATISWDGVDWVCNFIPMSFFDASCFMFTCMLQSTMLHIWVLFF